MGKRFNSLFIREPNFILQPARICSKEPCQMSSCRSLIIGTRLRFYVIFIYVIMWSANLMQQGNFIDVFLARHVSGTYAHHQEHLMLSCSIRFSALSFWKVGGLERHCIGRVPHGTIRTVHTTHSAALKTTTQPKTRCRKLYAATEHLKLLMMDVCTRNLSS